MATTMSSGIGASVLRKEDAPLITGQGRYVDDIKLPGMAYRGVRALAARARADHEHRHLGGRGHARRRQGVDGRDARPRGRRAVRLEPVRQRRPAQAADPGRGQGAHGRRAGRARSWPSRRPPRATRPIASSSTTSRCRGDRRRERRQAGRAAGPRRCARQPLLHDRAQDRGLRRGLRRGAGEGLADGRQPAPDAGADRAARSGGGLDHRPATSSRSTPRRRCRISCARSWPRSAASPSRRCA